MLSGIHRIVITPPLGMMSLTGASDCRSCCSSTSRSEGPPLHAMRPFLKGSDETKRLQEKAPFRCDAGTTRSRRYGEGAEDSAYLRNSEAHGFTPALRLSAGMARRAPFLGGAEGSVAGSRSEAPGHASGRPSGRIRWLRGGYSRRPIWRRNRDAMGPRELEAGWR